MGVVRGGEGMRWGRAVVIAPDKVLFQPKKNEEILIFFPLFLHKKCVVGTH